jgi:two-component system sensor histidine kinase TctE
MTRPLSLRRRLVGQGMALALVLSLLIYGAVRIGAEQASQAALDEVLATAAAAMAEELRVAEGGVSLSIPPATLSMLAAMGDERIFYRVDLGAESLTGYDTLPLPPRAPGALAPEFFDAQFLGADLRLAAVARTLRIEGRAVTALVILGQTREGQRAIATRLANRAAGLGLALFLIAIPLSLLAARGLLRPIDSLAEAVERRGPRDLRPVRHPAPIELEPFVQALNSFIARLRGTLSQTETFIAEAAHHIRTPLAVMRNEAELALRGAQDETTRARLRHLIRAADDSARSAGQLLDHATVLYRSGQGEMARIDLSAIARAVAERLTPAAEMKDIEIVTRHDQSMFVEGDAVLIEAALRNLLENAVKYSDSEAVIEITSQRNGAMAEVLVEDRGRGLGGEDAARLARRFRRGGNVSDTVGSGLGLTIVMEAAAAMGGRFTLTERNGGGACAAFSLPLA